MNQEVKYTGFTAVPSDYDAADGQLAVAINVVPEDNELKPVFQPHLVLDLKCDPTTSTDADGVTTTQTFTEPRVVYIHKTASIEHLIVLVTVDTTVGDANATREYVLYWLERDATEAVYEDKNKICAVTGFNHVNAIGNTLMIFADGSIQYVLWKKPEEAEEAYYLYLGDHIPHVQLSFGLVGEPVLVEHWDANDIKVDCHAKFDAFDVATFKNKDFPETQRNQITNDVMARVNETIAEYTVNKGRFCFPFFVRYALRLFDGSLACHSAPVLMFPSTKTVPYVPVYIPVESGEVNEVSFKVMLIAAQLDYGIVGAERSYLKNWTDIVKSVDVFISKPIYTFDQSGYVERLKKIRDATDCSVFTGSLTFKDFAKTDWYAEWNYADVFYELTNNYDYIFELPKFDDEATFTDALKNNVNFYKLESIDIEDIAGAPSVQRTVIDVPDDYLQSLVAREVMTDDYLTNDRMHAELSFAYNNRVHVAKVQRQPFRGFNPASLFQYCNTRIFKEPYIRCNHYYNGKELVTELEWLSNLQPIICQTKDYKIVTYINDDAQVATVSSDALSEGVNTMSFFAPWRWNSTILGKDLPTGSSVGSWFFYPNSKAYKMELYYTTEYFIASSATDETCKRQTLSFKATIDLTPHDFLNGAYALFNFEEGTVTCEDGELEEGFTTTSQKGAILHTDTGVTVIGTTDDGIALTPTCAQTNLYVASAPLDTSYPINVPNKVYSSEVNNPFYFPLNGINTIGSGEIRGLCSAAKALSQGQFGQFPLYAFTTDGVWALEVSSTGTFSAKQPITRDVCLSTDGITQLDSAVLFPSDRGLMLLSGSQVVCISDSINSEYPFNALDLPAFSKLHDMLGHDPLTDFCLPTVPFRKFLTDCRMVYDYVHQRVFVYNPSYTYAYVYSLKSTQWGMTFSTIASDVNSYPEALANNKDSELVNFSERITQTDGSTTPVLYVTRPLKFAGADVLKTVDNVIQRGFFQKGHIATALYGSRDLIHWHLVWTSKDHYLRGFRGTPYKYFRIAGVGTLDDDESITGASVQLDGRLTNQPR